MFEKLLALLPYNPSLAHQLAFYSRRMREEAAIRRIGMVFMVLTFMVQFFAVLSPPQPTSASTGSNNNLVFSGIKSAANAKGICQANTRHYKQILETYGISCADVGNGEHLHNLSSVSHGNKLYSMGWTPQGARNNRTGKITGESRVTVKGVDQHLYFRLLSSWDSGRSSNYPDYLKVRSSITGRVFYILFDCGNLVSIGIPPPVSTPKPPPKDYCPNLPGVQASTAECDVCPNLPGVQTSSSQCDVCKNVAGVQSKAADCDVCPNKAGIQTKASSCDVCSNVAGVQTKLSECDVCPATPGVQKQPTSCDVCPNVAGVQTKAAQCDVCPNLEGIQISANECDVCPNIAGVQTDEAQCDVCPNLEGIQSDAAECDVCPTKAGVQLDAADCGPLPCQFDSSLASDDANCKPCDKSSNPDDTIACVSIHKTAGNITAGLGDADNTTASAGDVILYTLYAQNSGQATVKDFVFQEDLSDVLVYADVTDAHGGIMDTEDVMSWPAMDIPAGQTVTRQVTVKVKDPIPETAADPGDPAHFDLVMTNVYGNAINIKLPGSPAKTVEVAAATLPNTGPGTGLFLAASLMVIGGYFYGRARLLARESALAIHENAVG